MTPAPEIIQADRERATAPCPNFEDHTPRPEGYIQWQEWAERMAKKYRQIKCGGCGRYAIWLPKSAQPTGDNPHD